MNLQYGAVQTSLEQFIKTNWELAEVTALQFENVAFNSEMYEEFAKFSIMFGQAVARTVSGDCYRQPGIVMMNVFVKPSVGTARLNVLSDIAAGLFNKAIVNAVDPLSAPVVKFKVPMFQKDLNEKHGWVMAAVTIPFYYDI